MLRYYAPKRLWITGSTYEKLTNNNEQLSVLVNLYKLNASSELTLLRSDPEVTWLLCNY